MRVQVHNILGDVARCLRLSGHKGAEVEQHLAAASDTIAGDPDELRTAFLKLARHASDIMPEGRQLVLSTGVVTLDAVQCLDSSHDIAPGLYLQVCLSVSGTEERDEIRRRLFEPLFAAMPPQYSEQLASAVAVIRKHNGALSFVCDPQHGNTFKIYLPLAASATKKGTTAATLHRAKEQSAHVLVVDDEEMVRDLIQQSLIAQGHTVTACSNGVEALQFFREAADTVDLVILDMVMPRLGGSETFRELIKINPAVKVLLCSGHSVESRQQALLQEGALGVVRKPFRLSQLHEKIEWALQHDTVVIAPSPSPTIAQGQSKTVNQLQ